jgi:hypothetical protein
MVAMDVLRLSACCEFLRGECSRGFCPLPYTLHPTPLTPYPPTQHQQEMTHVWKLLTLEARRKEGPDLDKFTDLALTFYFYYVNFGPLSRGTAATGKD